MPPISAAEIPATYRKALGLQAAGKLDQALQLHHAIARLNPNIAEVHFQVARIFAAAGKFTDALAHLRDACALKPSEVALWRFRAEVLRWQGQAAAVKAFQKDLLAAPLAPPQRAAVRKLAGGGDARRDRLGGLPATEAKSLAEMIAKHRFAAAEKRAAVLVARHPKSAHLADILARALAGQQNFQGALTQFRRATILAPEAGEIHNALGDLLLELGQPLDAAEELRRAIACAPDLAIARANLGRALTVMNQNDAALELLQSACDMAPDLGKAHYFRALLLVKLQRNAEARDGFETAIGLGYKTPLAQTMLARAQAVLGDAAGARANFDAAIAQDADFAMAYARRAALLQTLGDFDAAEADFRKAMALDPRDGETCRVFSTSHKFSADDPLLARMKAQINDPTLSSSDRVNLGFALSKAMEDIGEYDRVFTYLRPANALMRQENPYDVQTRVREIEQLKAAFEGVDFTKYEGVGDTSFAPIFVTGLPRSGTTLVEQILASHSTVTSAGEVGEFSRNAYRMIANPDGTFNALAGLDPARFTALGTDFAAFMRARFPKAMRLTDKSIQTYSFMGFVRLALPRARVVVVRRDPRDNLLSIYKNIFAEGHHRYAYDLSDLGAYYKLFDQMIDWWRQRLPGYFHEISYDALTAEPEREARKLLAACDLEWEDACLNFHANKNRVDTLSVYQVRQPIYRSSVRAWQRYESELGELFAALK